VCTRWENFIRIVLYLKSCRCQLWLWRSQISILLALLRVAGKTAFATVNFTIDTSNFSNTVLLFLKYKTLQQDLMFYEKKKHINKNLIMLQQKCSQGTQLGIWWYICALWLWWPRICSTCCKHFLSFPHSWLITGFLSRLIRRVSLVGQINTTGVTSGTGTAYPSGAPEFIPDF